MPEIDIVIATYERPAALERCLMALAHQTEIAPSRHRR